MPARRRNLKGQKFHHLTMIEGVRSGGAGKGMYWLAQCDCGNMKEVRGADVASGRIKTCGSCEHHKNIMAIKPPRPTPREAGIRSQLRRYIASALKRKISWLLTPEQFSEITAQDCTYCGAAPRAYRSRSPYRRRGILTTFMNGIDRIDSKGPYSMANTVPCCSVCNKMKMTLDALFFVEHCTKISRRMSEAKKMLDESRPE